MLLTTLMFDHTAGFILLQHRLAEGGTQLPQGHKRLVMRAQSSMLTVSCCHV
jgi:hypothetical protein